MWDESGLGLQPQSSHFTIICCLGVTQNSSQLPKACSTWAAVMCWGHIHMHIHTIWRLSYTLYVLGIDLRWIWIGSTVSITVFLLQLLPGSYPEFLLSFKSMDRMSSCNVVRTHPYAHPQHMKVVKHFMCLALIWDQSGLDYRLNHCIFLHLLPGSYPEFLLSSKSLDCMSSCNVVRTHPYAHPQHMKVVKHFVCAWH